ncbi:MAG: transposase [Planctomycetota bacterium]|nr:transposase [Planctomycetota bacterium]
MRKRREPETTVLYRLVQAEWNTFVQRAEAGERVVPRFCRREVEGYLRCGVLGYGFARVHCAQCKQDEVVAFSCKGRGFCPSCGTRRMADTAAWLVDRVLPAVPFRQWVLSLPYRVRLLCAYDADVCAGVRRILVRAVSGYYERAARREGRPRPRAGAVAWAQRFDSGLRLNLHFHVVWADGVFAHDLGAGGPEFCEHGEVRDEDVAKLVAAIRDRVLRYLRREGKWAAVGEEAETAADPELLQELGAAAVQGRAALGERAGERDVRVGRGTRSEPFVKGPQCADVEGFSLHAAVRVAARDRDRLEYLCRYAGRPAIAESRLAVLPDGRVAYSVKKKWKDGTTAVVMTPQVLMERLCALVPRPWRHLVTYHGAFAPAAGIRPFVVPQVVEENVAGDEGEAGGEVARGAVLRRIVPHAPGKRRRGGRRRYPWAELMRRVFLIDVLVCPRCGGPRRLLAAIHDPAAIRRVLGAMGLVAEVPVLCPARSPPRQAELPWE